MEFVLDKELSFARIKVEDKEDALDFLAKELVKKGYVKEGYEKAIVQREATYPTGLPSNYPAIAIPHADTKWVNQTTLAIATLEDAVIFKNMENVKEDIPINIVIMMAIKEPHGQIEMLQKIVNIIQNESLRQDIQQCQTNHDLFDLFTKSLAD